MKALSPGGALLRTSRVWSLPKQLKPPPSDARSPTATTGFPILQSVTTTRKSRKRGDWGFKYPLPRRMTAKTSTPYIRVLDVDAPESVTDFQTAADHTLSLEKFTEMNITMVQKAPRLGQPEPLRSVFEDAYDFIHMPKLNPNDPQADLESKSLYHKRWQFRGPWIAGMTDGEFSEYLDKAIRSPRQRGRFLYYLRKRLAIRKNEDRRRDDQRKGIQTPDWALLKPWNIAHEDVLAYTRYLRKNTPEMNEVMSEFLDLAPMRPAETLGLGRNYNWSSSPYAEHGPPSTHPSAGMSYLRSSAYMENHPLYGPQLYHSPVQGRVLQPGKSSSSKAIIGMGGFVVRPEEDLVNKGLSSRSLGLWSFDRSSRGGAKVWVSTDVGTVKPSGLVQLGATRAPEQAEWNARELRGEDVQRQRADRAMNSSTMSRASDLPRSAGPLQWNPNKF